MEASTQKIGSEARPLRVAIVGSGPAGFYAALALLKQTDVKVRIDLFDRLPTPYGLVRGGVAPDHQNIKAVAKAFQSGAMAAGVRFFGNVELARDVTVQEMKQFYDEIIYAIGNEDDRRMGIPGEGLRGVTPASVMVGWYNAHPDYRNVAVDFTSRKIAIIGNGNVAIDLARVLSKSPEELKATDIADHALEALTHSRITEVTVIGRRGPIQAAFTPRELQELGHLEQVAIETGPGELELDPVSQAALDGAPDKSNVRENYTLLRELTARADGDRPRAIRFRFLLSPVELIGDDSGHVRKLRLERNRLVESRPGAVAAEGTGEYEDLDVDWVFVSIGYQGRRLPDPPFDESRGTIANRDGRVIEPATGQVRPNEYVVGWAKSGPRGLIGMHRPASAAVVGLLFEDLAAGSVASRPDPGDEAVPNFLRAKGVRWVSFDEWLALDEEETERGKERGAPRRKISDVGEMLDVVDRGREGETGE